MTPPELANTPSPDYSEFIMTLRVDLVKHLIVAFFGALLLTLVGVNHFQVPLTVIAVIATCVVSLAALAKEVVWDFALDRGTPDPLDVFVSIAGAALGAGAAMLLTYIEAM
jgi:hypothetical protein